jgi:ubiquinone/menaquinone biosynthesis C-methylase UbiE
MSGSLPEMGDWDALFDESYLRTYLPFFGEERTRTEALGAAALAGVEPGAEVLDCPAGFGRHALVLAEAGYHVTAVDRSEAQLAEAERRRAGGEWPRLVRADYRELPFDEASFDAALNLFTSLGYLGTPGDVDVLREFRRVLRPGTALILETMHRDVLTRFTATRTWDRLPDDSFFLQEREPDWVAGTLSTLHLVVTPEGERIERRFVLRVYAVTEWVALLEEAGFEEIECFSDWEGTAPASPERRLIMRARRPVE